MSDEDLMNEVVSGLQTDSDGLVICAAHEEMLALQARDVAQAALQAALQAAAQAYQGKMARVAEYK